MEKSIKDLFSQPQPYFFNQLTQHPLPPYYVYIWSRDCDMCESSRVRVVMTYIGLVRSYADYIHGLEWAEGPSSWQLIDATADIGSNTRDRVLEAFENGSNYLV